MHPDTPAAPATAPSGQPLLGQPLQVGRHDHCHATLDMIQLFTSQKSCVNWISTHYSFEYPDIWISGWCNNGVLYNVYLTVKNLDCRLWIYGGGFWHFQYLPVLEINIYLLLILLSNKKMFQVISVCPPGSRPTQIKHQPSLDVQNQWLSTSLDMK